jgi:nitric oxide synthase oxygenase domain/subunit
MAKWGQYLPDGSQMGWKNVCKAYMRLHWAELNVDKFKYLPQSALVEKTLLVKY